MLPLQIDRESQLITKFLRLTTSLKDVVGRSNFYSYPMNLPSTIRFQELSDGEVTTLNNAKQRFIATLMIYDKATQQHIKTFGQLLVPIDISSMTFGDLYAEVAAKLSRVKQESDGSLKFDETDMELWICHF